MYIIGIDGGGTKTVGILATATGQHLAQGQSGPANYHVVGEAQTQAVLEGIVAELYEKSGYSTNKSLFGSVWAWLVWDALQTEK